ncbi:hypothetical protein GPECTOR_39g396 [Gonium pectorale]|uniref:non-specific serine/threonine protein kinase n=1 Tax=Gonium pectorale TaxID=33097 RepID=A0A150GAN1_GONPE|nr:hypothetical protein GPECTOR_39g396 [Gonium pectorale]|eukprot:KXZ46902.1 hypothetical protein GPECTOR_39g396 [Gonium pectorale]
MEEPQPLGRGGMGSVYGWTPKTVLKRSANDAAIGIEARVLHHIGISPCVVELRGLRSMQDGVGIVLERAEYSLEQFLADVDGQRLPDPMSPVSQQVAAMLIGCVAEVHSRGVIHGDIKSANVLVASDGSLKLCDFNLSRVASDNCPAEGCTLLYASPMLLCGEDEGYSADWWAVGITLYQMFRGAFTWPFASRARAEAILRQRSYEARLGDVREAVGRGAPYFGTLPAPIVTLLRGLLDPDPIARWGLAEVLSCDFPNAAAYREVAHDFAELAPLMERLLTTAALSCHASPAGAQVQDLQVLEDMRRLLEHKRRTCPVKPVPKLLPRHGAADRQGDVTLGSGRHGVNTCRKALLPAMDAVRTQDWDRDRERDGRGAKANDDLLQKTAPAPPETLAVVAVVRLGPQRPTGQQAAVAAAAAARAPAGDYRRPGWSVTEDDQLPCSEDSLFTLHLANSAHPSPREAAAAAVPIAAAGGIQVPIAEDQEEQRPTWGTAEDDSAAVRMGSPRGGNADAGEEEEEEDEQGAAEGLAAVARVCGG